MNRIPAALWIVGLGVLHNGCSAPSPAAFDELHRQAVQDSVLQVLEAFTETVNRGDLNGMLGYYADDPAFHWVENGAIAYPSYAAVARTFEVLMATMAELRLTVTNPRVVALAPGVATITATYRQLFVENSGRQFDVRGAMTMTAVHRPEGWKFLTGHASQLPSVTP